MPPIPKPSRNPKPRKKIARRGRFKPFNPSKATRRRTDAKIFAYAMQKRNERLFNPTLAEDALATILNVSGVAFKREHFVQNGDSFILLDFFIPGMKLAIECDGSSHRGIEKRDQGRDKWLMSEHGIWTIRLTNEQVLKGGPALNHLIGMLTA